MSLHSVLQMRYSSPLRSRAGARRYFARVSSAKALANIAEKLIPTANSVQASARN